MNKATRRQKELAAKCNMMIVDGKVYTHDPATVGHKRHDATCWTLVVSEDTPEETSMTPTTTGRKRIKVPQCQVFLLCTNPATTTINNVILGQVPACQRCADKMAAL